ncbi:hypothetical protein Cob_v011649 [Colletotrichum orbiculare MAFF 240422]|uniref:Nudix hydrolase domain-containing protein n=1 Tax=Colletotrichum orbiculare (strain 104-T / ATCC 96160 / CBS 514.97 / LARS 414 / MAFF 240422) TaxID=1213857 RepID=N4V4R9_COLOR|nr:hypothetical protein Cob_v011649 [Colletotrichum orbiculare MAFF 240422]
MRLPHLRPTLRFSSSSITTTPHRHFSPTSTALKAKMPPPPPSPPLSYTTSPAVNPYLVRYHPLSPTSTLHASSTHRLAVGAAVVLNTSSAPPRLLVLQRSAFEKALPHRWETPGGAAEAADGNLVASAARELWEETGLRAKRVRGLVGSYQWSGFGPSVDAPVAPGEQAVALPGGGVGIASVVGEEEGGRLVVGRDAWRKFTYLVEVEAAGDGEIEVKIDPEEHENYVWATEEEVKADRAGHVALEWTSEHQKMDLLKAFEMTRKK